MESSAQEHVLRPYNRPPDNFSFVGSTPGSGMTSPRGVASVGVAAAERGGAPPLVLPPRTGNRYMPAEADAPATPMAMSRSAASAVLTSMLVSGALQYTSTCLAMPFEVGKLLLQVQWVPREDVWRKLNEPDIAPSALSMPRHAALGHDLDDDPWHEHDEGEQRYFEEVGAPPASATSHHDVSGTSSPLPARKIDANGYVVQDHSGDESARPEFLMPVVVKGGVWEMIKAVARGKEGWTGLWKGVFTTFVLDLATQALQPVVSGVLSLFTSSVHSMPIVFSPRPLATLGLLLSSHLITGFLVSPLDLVRTRLIAQSTLPQHRKYAGLADALQTILREEGGWRTTYLHPNLLVPTLLDFLFRPLFALGAPLVLENVFRLDPNTVPISYALGELVVSTLSLLVTLPIETVRRRLQLQYHEPLRGDAIQNLFVAPNLHTGRRGLRTCVETRPVPYSGVFEAVYRIIAEETVILPAVLGDDAEPSTIAVSSVSRFGGLRGLYRGFGMGFSANLLVFVLTLLTGERQINQTGWTEI